MLHRRSSGLLVPERAAAPREIADQLLRLAPPVLELRQEVDERHQMYVWRVFAAVPDRPSAWLFDWRENLDDPTSRPRPLSSALVDEAASRKRGESRRVFEDPLAVNDRLRAEQEKDALEDALTAAAEMRRRKGRVSPLPRSRALYLARNRARARGIKA